LKLKYGLALNENQYQELCESCDRVLLAPEVTIERVAISWLHVIREHPIFLQNYEGLFGPEKNSKYLAKKIVRNLRFKAGWIKQLGRAFHTDARQGCGPVDNPQGIDVLFVSHLLNASQVGKKDDFYFGNIPSKLHSEKKTSVVALINSSGSSALSLLNKWNDRTVPRVILSNSFRILGELSIYCRLKIESRRLLQLAKKEAHGLYRSILIRASEEALSGGSHTNLRRAIQVGELVAKLRPKAIVVTYEGHAWERVVFAAARSVCPDIRCVGYQHAALFRLQHSIRRNLAMEYNPDEILTAGEVFNSQLRRAPGLRGIPINVLGSNRSHIKVTENDENNVHKEKLKYVDQFSCLVLPEGLPEECHILFDYSLACAKILPKVNFIWRLHPVIEFETLISENPNLRQLPGNIELSKRSLDEDVRRCRWALYRGSTAIVQAVSAGLRPIYYRNSTEMTVDPLYGLNAWKRCVESVSEFKHLLEDENEQGTSVSSAEAEIAREYCNVFYVPFDHTVLVHSVANLSEHPLDRAPTKTN